MGHGRLQPAQSNGRPPWPDSKNSHVYTAGSVACMESQSRPMIFWHVPTAGAFVILNVGKAVLGKRVEVVVGNAVRGCGVGRVLGRGVGSFVGAEVGPLLGNEVVGNLVVGIVGVAVGCRVDFVGIGVGRALGAADGGRG